LIELSAAGATRRRRRELECEDASRASGHTRADAPRVELLASINSTWPKATAKAAARGGGGKHDEL
jgi:hypothetical protein